jgi:monoamine oxidase
MTDHALSRRRLLGAGAAASTGALAAAALPDVADAKARRKPRKARPRSVDVVVVGGGLSGLTAARRVAAAGRSVVVLEARDRVGGRTLNHDVAPGRPVEAGGEYVGPTQNHVLNACREMQIGVYQAYFKGDSSYVADGQVSRYQGDIPPAALDLVGLQDLLSQVNGMADSFRVGEPWGHPQAAELEGQSVDSWLRSRGLLMTPRVHELVECLIEPSFGASNREISMLLFAWFVNGSGDEQHKGTVERMLGGKGGGQDSRILGGSQLISLAMADALGAARVRLNAPVRRVTQAGGRLEVVSDAGTWKARKVVVAVPPPLAAAIDFQPVLPAEHRMLLQRSPMGALMKCEAVYDKPFWREQGLNGSAVVAGGYPMKVIFDNTPPEGGPGVLFGFCGGDSWRRFSGLPVRERRELVLRQFAKHVGPQALKAKDYFDMDWGREPWSAGGPVAIPSAGTLTGFGRWIRRPHGDVHFAGTETADYWAGFMDGAISAGKRAAREVLA